MGPPLAGSALSLADRQPLDVHSAQRRPMHHQDRMDTAPDGQEERLLLPSIMNGDMSWVGRRSQRPEFVRHFLREIRWYGLRHPVRPGLTGMVQVLCPSMTRSGAPAGWFLS